jgi:hypothetical protein
MRQTELHLDGLWIAGGIQLSGGALVTVKDCTVGPPLPGRPGAPGIALADRAERRGAGENLLSIRAERSILGPVDLGGYRGRLSLADCVIDGGGDGAIRAPQATADLARCTVLGTAEVGQVGWAVDSLFAGALRVGLPSEGEVRYSYLAGGSRTPEQERCQGEGAEGPTRIEGAVTPAFTSVAFGHPAYAQLSPAASRALRHGAEDGNEIGVYNRLRQGDRMANLPRALDEFMPWGMQAKIFYVT